jgi:hypothetical protein
MRMFSYVEPGPNDEPVEVIMTEQEIFDTYWPFWYNKMVLKFGNDHPLINWENCLYDWVTVNWATKIEKPATEK